MSPMAKSLRFGLCALFLLCSINQCFAYELHETSLPALAKIDTSVHRKIPDTLFGVFFEEINHAVTGGIWAELVSNRGFQAGGENQTNIAPWTVIGDESLISVVTEQSSCFRNNKLALKMEISCDTAGSVVCPADGVGVYNPGFWGMNIEKGQKYRLVFYVQSLDPVNITASIKSGDGLVKLASTKIITDDSDWQKVEQLLQATGTDRNARLELTTTKKGVILLDQVSLMPLDTYKGHGFRKDLIAMVEDLKPRFLRFPGGCFVEGEYQKNAYRWKETIGPWEERPGHFGDVWNYWTDDGLGFLEYLQLAEDLGVSPVYVINIGISHQEQVATAEIFPYIKDVLESIEFARGTPSSVWGSVRAGLGRRDAFKIEYVALGNEDCGKTNYVGNYVQFHTAIRAAYPDIKIISNCDGTVGPLDHPADLYDLHLFNDATHLFSMKNRFDNTSRDGPKTFVSQYAALGKGAGNGSLLTSLGEAAFLIGLERNSDVVAMASYAPLFVNANDRRWNPDAIVFDSWQVYGTPSYWMQHFFKESSGATLLGLSFEASSTDLLAASAIIWEDLMNKKYLKIKVVNFQSSTVDLRISIDGQQNFTGSPFQSNVTTLTSSNIEDENSFAEPTKVAPVISSVPYLGSETLIPLASNSLTSINLPWFEMK